jgi:Tol biopolymer transport system component
LWLDPFTGGRRTLSPDFPNLYDGYPLPDWGKPWGMSLSVYNARITRAVYLAKPGYAYVLWDMQKKQALLNWVDISQDDPPRWSPDGSKFLMSVADASDTPGVYPNGLYLVDENGTVSLPALSDIYAASQTSVQDYFWSPSGRFIAFLADVKDVPNGEFKERLWVLDLQIRKITDYCVEFTPTQDGASLIWSPDETQILLNDQFSRDRRRVILVDLARGIAFPIAEDMIATGWMKSP